MPKPVCEKCGQKPATVNVATAFAGGRSSLPTSVQRLCKQCAAGFVNEAEKYRESNRAELRESLKAILAADPSHPVEAYEFILHSIGGAMFTAKNSGRPPLDFTGPEILESVRRFALRRFGLRARRQLRVWGITCTEDIGEIIFKMLDGGFWWKHPEFKRKDFSNGYDFESTFPEKEPAPPNSRN